VRTTSDILSPQKEVDALVVGERESEGLGGDGAIAQGFAVDENAVAIEDEEFRREQVPLKNRRIRETLALFGMHLLRLLSITSIMGFASLGDGI